MITTIPNSSGHVETLRGQILYCQVKYNILKQKVYILYTKEGKRAYDQNSILRALNNR